MSNSFTNSLGSNEVEFNEALGIINRLDVLQQRINDSMTNLFSINKDGTNYEYHDCYSNLTNIFLEISHDVTPQEEKEVKRIQDLIDRALQLQFFSRENNHNLGGNRMVTIPVIQNMNILTKLLQNYRMFINKLRKIHGYTNPEKANNRRAMGS